MTRESIYDYNFYRDFTFHIYFSFILFFALDSEFVRI